MQQIRFWVVNGAPPALPALHWSCSVMRFRTRAGKNFLQREINVSASPEALLRFPTDKSGKKTANKCSTENSHNYLEGNSHTAGDVSAQTILSFYQLNERIAANADKLMLNTLNSNPKDNSGRTCVLKNKCQVSTNCKTAV